jgi:hypothetical protein
MGRRSRVGPPGNARPGRALQPLPLPPAPRVVRVGTTTPPGVYGAGQDIEVQN